MQIKRIPYFKKSSFSDERVKLVRCVEAAIEPDKVLVRHSRNPSVVLEFNYGEWEAFLLGVKNNDFDLS